MSAMQYEDLNLTIEDAVPPVVHASGELDAQSSDFFESTLRRDVLGRTGTCNLELSDLTYIDSSGLRALVKAALEADKAGHQLNITSMSPYLDHMLTVAGFKHLFRIDGMEQPAMEDAKTGLLSVPPCAFEIPKGVGACRQVRDKVHGFAQSMGFSGNALEDIRLAVGEAMSNAIRHGAITCETIKVRCENSEHSLIIHIAYPSAEFDPSAVPIPTYSTAAEGGMGIYFMKLVMDKVNYEFAQGRTEVTLVKKLA